MTPKVKTVFTIGRPPRTDDELWWLIRALWGVTLPRVKVCPDHVSPFEALAHAYFARDPNYAVWYASRGSGKSLALAVLGLTKAFVDEVDVTIIGGSMVQSLNVRNHMSDMLEFERAPSFAVEKDNVTLLETLEGTKIEPLPASQKTVRGKHPVLQLLDEVDEMELDIYDSSLGQAMPQISNNPAVTAGLPASDEGKVVEYVVASSTWQNPEGTFSEVIDRARDNGQPIFTWCWRELIRNAANPYGWMSERFIENKRKTVSAQMWKTEYELNEPSGQSRAFDLDKVAEYFIDYPAPIEERHQTDDDLWVWERPAAGGIYAVGADWGKEKDKTVISVIRYDVFPHLMVKLRVVNRRPWDMMLGWYDADLAEYNAVGQHDKTGLGGALNDFIDNEDGSGGFVFVGRKRTHMIVDYIAEFEHGRYRLPKVAASMYRGHRATTVGAVYATGQSDKHHLPDEVASMALANRAVKKMAMPIGDYAATNVNPLAKSSRDAPRKADRDFHVRPELIETNTGVVRISDDPADTYDLII